MPKKLKSSISITDKSDFVLKDGEYLLIDNIADNTEYEVTENNTDNWILDSSENPAGTVTAGTLSTVIFHNKYTSNYKAKGNTRIVVNKQMVNGIIEDEDKLLFDLLDESDNLLQEKTVDNTGGNSSTVTFDPISYTEEDIGKKFTYFVKERKGDNPYIIYDSNQYEIEVTVEDNGDGSLNPTIKYVTYDGNQKQLSDNMPTLKNYKSGSLKIQKNVTTTNDQPLNNNAQFAFTVTLEDTYHDENEKIIFNNDIFKNNVAHVKVGANDSLLLEGIPAGMTYTVTEDDKTDYRLDNKENDTGEIIENQIKTTTFQNIYAVSNTHNLMVTKRVRGNMGDKNQEFNFVLKLEGKEIPEILSFIKTKDGINHPGTKKLSDNNTYVFKLKHGDSITFNNLPIGTKFAVTETDAEIHLYSSTGENITGVIDENITASFINTRNIAIPSNVRFDGWKMLCIMLTIMSLLYLIIRKTKKI